MIYRRDDKVISGTQILQAAYKFELNRLRGLEHEYTIKSMKMDKNKYPVEVVEALQWAVSDKES